MILVIIFLLCALVITSLLESSYSSLNIIRIKKLMENRNKKAKMVYKLYSKYSEAITSILVVNFVCIVMVSSLTTYYFSNVYGDGSVTLVTIILTLIVLIFTEITPKILGREYSEVVAMRLALVLKTIMFILTPINKIISKFERKVKNKHKVTATKDELVEIVKTIKDEGVIEEKESAFIQKAVILKRLRVQNIMISKDNKIVGILYEVDLLDEILNDGTISIKRNVKEPVTVSKNTNLASCLEVLHGARAHMALVTDRENNFLGIVTMEDIINELMKS